MINQTDPNYNKDKLEVQVDFPHNVGDFLTPHYHFFRGEICHVTSLGVGIYDAGFPTSKGSIFGLCGCFLVGFNHPFESPSSKWIHLSQTKLR